MNRPGSRLAGAALIACAVAVVTASGTASAMFHRGPEVSSGDDRATARQARGQFDLDCSDAGLAGSRVDVVAFTDDGRSRLTITSVPTGVRLTGVVVQGALAYNVYPRAPLGTLPFVDLRAPVYGEGHALILRWFACGSGTVSQAVVPAPAGTSGPAPAAGVTPAAGHPTATATPAGAEVTVGSAALPGGAEASTPGAAGRPDGTPASGATPGVLAGGGPSAADSPPLQKVARVGLGGSLYLAVAMLLLVTGGFLVVAPRHLTASLARLRPRG